MELEKGEALEPVSPTGQYFNSPALCISILTVFQVQVPMIAQILFKNNINYILKFHLIISPNNYLKYSLYDYVIHYIKLLS
jgi:hypothetical protein